MTASYQDLAELTDSLKKGQVKTVIIHGINPMYALPDGSEFKEALKKAEMVFYTPPSRSLTLTNK